MGGFGSGRHGGKSTTGDMHVLDIRKIARAGRLTPGQSFGWQWTCNGEKIASINMRTETDKVTLDQRPVRSLVADCPASLHGSHCR